MVWDLLTLGGVVLASAAGALALLEVVHRVLRRLGRRTPFLGELARLAHRPAQASVAVCAAFVALRFLRAPDEASHAVLLVLIAAAAWLVAALLLVVEDAALSRVRVDVPDNRQARKVRTQVVVIRRVTVAGVAVMAFGAMLTTFPQARSVGASLLASAGIIGIIAGLAAQSTLANMFAGVQLAFSDAVRLDDVVVIEGEWGKVEEITLSNVVVRLWDDRRLVMPTSYFAGKPFENWTRRSAALLGTVELDVDWSVPVEAMREELRRILSDVPSLWDGRVCVLQVTSATGPLLRVRAVVSAGDAAALWDLRCHVREHLVVWVRSYQPAAIPRVRTELLAASDPDGDELVGPHRSARDSLVFGGSRDGRERASAFTGPDESR